jgi:hypothetical protein
MAALSVCGQVFFVAPSERPRGFDRETLIRLKEGVAA